MPADSNKWSFANGQWAALDIHPEPFESLEDWSTEHLRKVGYELAFELDLLAFDGIQVYRRADESQHEWPWAVDVCVSASYSYMIYVANLPSLLQVLQLLEPVVSNNNMVAIKCDLQHIGLLPGRTDYAGWKKLASVVRNFIRQYS